MTRAWRTGSRRRSSPASRAQARRPPVRPIRSKTVHSERGSRHALRQCGASPAMLHIDAAGRYCCFRSVPVLGGPCVCRCQGGRRAVCSPRGLRSAVLPGAGCTGSRCCSTGVCRVCVHVVSRPELMRTSRGLRWLRRPGTTSRTEDGRSREFRQVRPLASTASTAFGECRPPVDPARFDSATAAGPKR